MAIEGRLLAGRYRLGPRLGEGGMAVVHQARDEVLNRNVAVKILRPEYAADPEFVRRFQREAQNAASLAHRNIVPVFDTGLDDADHFIVMQLVDGVDLEQAIAERGALPVAEALRIVFAVAEALQGAHERDILHRDVKPGNILLTSEGEVRVVDFGIARALGDARTTRTGQVLGSVHYASPEQVLGEPVGPASDVYSLGVVLYELLTGQRPFEGSTAAAVALKRLHETPPSPSEIAALPADLDRIVMRAMARQPTDRYGSAQALASAIRGWWRKDRRRPSRAVTDVLRPSAPVAAGAGAVAAAAARTPTGLIGPQPVARAGIRVEPGAAAPRGKVARPSPEDAPRRRRSTAALWLLPASAVLFVAAAAWIVGRGLFLDGAVLSATAEPTLAAVAPSPAASLTPPASTTAPPTAPPTPDPTPGTTSSPPPTAPPTPQPTPPPTPAPAPLPTPRPPAEPVVAPASAAPASVVAQFYDLVEAHDFDAAASLWTARMRAQYPPGGYIDGRFAPTTRIDLARSEVIALNTVRGTAVVAVDLTEYRTEEPSPRRFVGQWEMVLTDSGWRMDEPHF